MLERDRLDRAILRARGRAGSDADPAVTGVLAREREAVRESIRAVGARLETGD